MFAKVNNAISATKVTKQKMTVVSPSGFLAGHRTASRLKPPDGLATKGRSPVIFLRSIGSDCPEYKAGAAPPGQSNLNAFQS